MAGTKGGSTTEKDGESRGKKGWVEGGMEERGEEQADVWGWERRCDGVQRANLL